MFFHESLRFYTKEEQQEMIRTGILSSLCLCLIKTAVLQNPLSFKDRADIRLWLKELGPVVQLYADVLERELQKA